MANSPDSRVTACTLIHFYHILWLLLGWLVSHTCWRVAGRRGMSMQPAARSYTLSALLAFSTVAVFDSVRAAENATGFYILGLKTTMAGYTPPPGTYLTDINYFYAGDARADAAVGIAL